MLADEYRIRRNCKWYYLFRIECIDARHVQSDSIVRRKDKFC